MKRRIISTFLAIWIIVAIPLTAYAATPRLLAANPVLQFNGATAICSVTITSESDEIEATIKLNKGTSCIATWNASGTGYIIFNESKGVSSKGEYTLTVDITINGVKQPQISDTKTYE